MNGRRLRPLVGMLFALLSCAVVAGCVTLPHSSAINPGRGAVQRTSNIIFNSPPGPQVGATKAEIVNGYLQAMLAYPQSPTLVREFFTPTAGQAWEPGLLLRVYQNGSVTERPNGTVDLDGQVLGSLDERGSWVSATSSDDVLGIELILDRVDGQWRISNPPPGMLLDTDTFARYYHQYSLYYFDPTHTLLIPDPVYQLLGTPTHTATALVRNLLLGPTASMGGVVSAQVPLLTHVVGVVTVSPSGLATVPLSRNVASLSPGDLELLAAQLAWTLRQERLGINRLRITVSGRVLRVPGLSRAFSVESFPGNDPTIYGASRSLYALSDGHLVTVTPTGHFRVQGPIGSLVARAQSAGIDPNGSRAALVIHNRTAVVVGGMVAGDQPVGNRAWFQGGDSLLKPSWDGHNLLWLVDATPAGAVVRVVTAAGARVVSAPGISSKDVRAFAVSRDGMRFAAIVGRGATSRLVIAMILRNPTSPTDVSLTEVQTIENAAYPLVNLTRVVWNSPTTVAVLAQNAGSEPQPYEISIDGSKVQPTTGFLPVRPVSLAADADPDIQPVIGTGDGRLYMRSPNQQWPALSSRPPLFAPTYPG